MFMRTQGYDYPLVLYQTWQWKILHLWMNFGLKPSFIVDFQLLCLIAGGYEVRSNISRGKTYHMAMKNPQQVTHWMKLEDFQNVSVLGSKISTF